MVNALMAHSMGQNTPLFIFNLNSQPDLQKQRMRDFVISCRIFMSEHLTGGLIDGKDFCQIAEDITKAWLHAHARKGSWYRAQPMWLNSTGGYMTP